MRVPLIIALLCAAVSSFAQWNPNGANTYYTGGNVGIGRQDPQYLLDVTGVIRSSGYLRITGIDETSGLIADDGWGSTIFSITRQPENETRFQSYGFHTFYSGNNTGSEKMRIAANGNVGIGTTAPITLLHVQGESIPTVDNVDAKEVLRLSRPGNGAGQQEVGMGIFLSKYSGANANSYSRVDFRLSNIGSTANGWGTDLELITPTMSILGNGNVGVGTTSPTVKLEVNGDVNIGSNIGTVDGYGVKLNFLGNSLNGDPLWISRYNNGANNSEMRINIGDDFGQAQDMFVVGTHHWNGGEWKPHFSVHASGNVGIGTTNPTQKLTVNGTVYSTEVKVDLAAGTGPDYVFEPYYNLPSLTEIETYIKANKHLPEVPSAKEMETNGINLSEMNMLLLKKVEELTLHLIEQQKEIELLKMKIK